MRTEEEKKQYYRYGIDSSNWVFKEPDELPRSIIELMQYHGVADRYRFVWMGAAVMRLIKQGHDRNPVIKGDPRACISVKMSISTQVSNFHIPQIVDWLTPKDFFVRRATPGEWYWIDDDGARHTADRADQLLPPPGRPVARQDYLVDLGHLVWSLQYRLTGEQMVAGRFSTAADAPDEYWQTIKTFRNPEGGYIQPVEEDVREMILKREQENQNLSDGQMREKIEKEIIASDKRFAEFQSKAELARKAEWDKLTEEIIADNALSATQFRLGKNA